MNVIRSLVLASAIAIAMSASAQSATSAPQPAAGSPDAAAIQKLRERIRTDPKAVVAQNLNLTEAEAKAFWPVYDKCHLGLDAAQRKFNRAIRDFVDGPGAMTDAHAKQITDDLLVAESDEAGARKSCFKSVSKVLPGKKAARYLQIESKIRALTRFDAAVVIPLVD